MSGARGEGLRFEVYGGEFPAEPAGGMRDFRRAFASADLAIAYALGYLDARSSGWAHIYDALEAREIWTDAQA